MITDDLNGKGLVLTVHKSEDIHIMDGRIVIRVFIDGGLTKVRIIAEKDISIKRVKNGLAPGPVKGRNIQVFKKRVTKTT